MSSRLFTIRGDVLQGVDEAADAGQLEQLVEFTAQLPIVAARVVEKGGTILGTSRTNPYKTEGGPDAIRETFEKNKLDAFIAVGGEDTLGVGHRLYQDGFPIVGVPKTIDNDICGTDFTFGFDTAVSIATEAIDRLHTTAESHNRVVVVEVAAGRLLVRAADGGDAA